MITTWRRRLVWPLLIFGFVTLIYHDAWQFGLISDANYLLYQSSESIMKAISWDGSYRYRPASMILNYTQYLLFGLNEAAYQISNLAQHALVAVLLFWLALELTAKELVAVLAGFLFAVASGFYEVPLWTIAGNFYTLAASLYIVALIALARFLRTSIVGYWWVYLGSSTLALFAHEFTVSLVPVSVAYYLLVHEPGLLSMWVRDGIFSERVRRMVRTFVLPMLILATYVGLKIVLNAQAQPLERGLVFGYGGGLFNLVKGFIVSLTLRADTRFLHPLTSLGVADGIASPFWLVVALLWTVAFVKWFDEIERFCTVWLAAYLLLVLVAVGGASPRYWYLSSLPGVLLIAKLTDRFATWLAQRTAGRLKRWPEEGERWLAVGISLVVFSALALPAYEDLRLAKHVWQRANSGQEMLFSIIEKQASRHPDATNLYIVNPPDKIREDGVAAWAFLNGLPQAIELRYPELFDSTNIVYTNPQLQPVSGGRQVDLLTFERIVANPQNLVVVYDPHSDETYYLATSQASAIVPGLIYTPKSAPMLEWHEGAWSWLSLAPDESLEFPFRPDFEGPYWVSIFHNSDLRDAASILSNGQPVDDPVVSRARLQGWYTTEFLAPQAISNATISVTLHNTNAQGVIISIGYIALRQPLTEYNEATAPYLEWQAGSWSWLGIWPGSPLTLPLRLEGAGPFALSLFYAHEWNRALQVRAGGLLLANLEASRDEAPEWRTVELPLPTIEENVILITLEGNGGTSALIGNLGIVEAPSSQPPPK